jgi:hypothetical protein
MFMTSEILILTTLVDFVKLNSKEILFKYYARFENDNPNSPKKVGWDT